MDKTTPNNWFLAGSNPTAYDVGIDKTTNLPGRQSAYIASKGEAPEGFGTLNPRPLNLDLKS
jgi:hypothetical protein